MPKGKVITVLSERPAIEAALEELARARTEEETTAPLQALASYGMAALPVLITHLGTTDPWMVRALGRTLAQLPDVRRAAEALHRAILDPASSDRRRIVAMVLLDQFLRQPLDESLFAALGSPAQVATEALLREAAPEERPARLDYLSILHVQSTEEILHALRRFGEEESDPAIEALTFFALDERENVAGTAVELLGTIRRPAALRALRILAPNVPTSRLPAVERVQRKLLLGGLPDEPLPAWPAGARVQISTLDGAGNLLLLFLFPSSSGYCGLHIFLNDGVGIQGAYEVDYPAEEISSPAPGGAVCRGPHPWRDVPMLESGPAYAHLLLRQALLRDEGRESPCPVEYRFFCGRIWGWSVPPDRPADAPEASGTEPRAGGALLETPYLSSWFLAGGLVLHFAAAMSPLDWSRPGDRDRFNRAAAALLQSECTREWCDRQAARLRTMVGWLMRAGEPRWAAAAQAALEDLERTGSESWFARAMVHKGLRIALESVRHRDGD